MSSAERSKRYRARKRDADNVTPPSPVTVLTDALDALCDLSECVTPAELVDELDDLTAMGVADDARLLSSWLATLQVLASRRARP
jgi:hypothetical protein